MKLHPLSALLLAAATLTLTGCVGAGAPAAPMAANNIYLDANAVPGPNIQPEIADFDPSGCCSTIFSGTPGSVGITAVATDSSGNVYAALFDFYAGAAEIDVFAPGAVSASGTVTPTRAFYNGFMTAAVRDLTVDPSGNVYVIDDNDNLFKFTPSANGIAQPSLMLSGFNTGNGMTTDAKGNLYLSVYCIGGCGGFSNSIYVYAAGFDNATPQNIINPPNAEYIDGLAVDASGTIYASTELVSGSGAGQIEAYAPTATGNATPIRVITGSNTLLAGTSSTLSFDYNTLAMDGAGTLYVRSIGDLGRSALSTINEFPSTASGNVAPAVTIAAGLPSNFYNIDIAVAYAGPQLHANR